MTVYVLFEIKIIADIKVMKITLWFRSLQNVRILQRNSYNIIKQTLKYFQKAPSIKLKPTSHRQHVVSQNHS